MLSGGWSIDDVLAGRLSVSNRTHDGYIAEAGNGPDFDSGKERNVAAQLLLTPRDDFQMKLRYNDAQIDRVMGGADGGGLVILRGESQDGLSRDYNKYVFGYRAIDPSVTDPMNRGSMMQLSQYTPSPTLMAARTSRPNTSDPALTECST